MLKDEIRKNFNEARKSGNAVAKSALEAVIAAMLLKEKSGAGRELSDSDVMECITKEIKIQREIEEMYKDKNAEKSVEAAEKAAVLSAYLPPQLTDEEVLAIIAEVAPADDKSPKAKGAIMKNLIPRIAGRFDKSKVNALVEKFLNE